MTNIQPIEEAVSHAWRLAEICSEDAIADDIESSTMTNCIAVWDPECPDERCVVCYDPVPVRQ